MNFFKKISPGCPEGYFDTCIIHKEVKEYYLAIPIYHGAA
jgi:hypothetical protein